MNVLTVDAKPSDLDWMRRVDEAILEDLRREQPDYIPLVANRLGMHLDYVDERSRRLVEHGLLEQVTGEAVYCVTDRGERYLANDLDLSDCRDGT